MRASGYKDTRVGRAMISRCRKKALAGEDGPFDVEILDGLKARLYPNENRCEKRAFTGVQTWDYKERAALSKAVDDCASTPFVFLDVGANVGLYSLYVHKLVKSAGKSARILAIEPGISTSRRLENNIAINNADIQIIRAAVSDVPGSGHLSGWDKNRGEARLMDQTSDEGSEPVVIDTLPRICRTQNLTHIDAMKVDIEGHDYKAMTAFFEDAPKTLRPALLVLETGKDEASPLIALCQKHNYIVSERAGLNTIFRKEEHV